MPWPFTRKKGKAQPMPGARNISGIHSAFNANNFTQNVIKGIVKIRNQANLNKYVKTRIASLKILARSSRHSAAAKRALNAINTAYKHHSTVLKTPIGNLLGLNNRPNKSVPIDPKVFNTFSTGNGPLVSPFNPFENRNQKKMTRKAPSERNRNDVDTAIRRAIGIADKRKDTPLKKAQFLLESGKLAVAPLIKAVQFAAAAKFAQIEAGVKSIKGNVYENKNTKSVVKMLSKIASQASKLAEEAAEQTDIAKAHYAAQIARESVAGFKNSTNEAEANEYEGMENPWKEVVPGKQNNLTKPNAHVPMPMANIYGDNPFLNRNKKGEKPNINPFKNTRKITGNPFKNTEGYQTGIELNTSSTGNPFGASRRRPWWKRFLRK